MRKTMDTRPFVLLGRKRAPRTYKIVSFPDPAFFTKDKGLAHFARILGLVDSVLPEIWRTNILVDHVVRIVLPEKNTLNL